MDKNKTNEPQSKGKIIRITGPKMAKREKKYAAKGRTILTSYNDGKIWTQEKEWVDGNRVIVEYSGEQSDVKSNALREAYENGLVKAQVNKQPPQTKKAGKMR